MKGRRSGFILILLGMMVALLVAVMVFSTAQKASSETKIESADVVVALREVAERSIVPAEALAIKKLPADAVPAGALATIAQVSGRMTTTRVYPGEIILSPKLADTKGQSGMAYSLDKGKVLITFPLSDLVTTGALHVGDTIDILVTYRPPSQTGPGAAPATATTPATTQTTMQNLKIVSLGTVSATKTGQGGPAPAGNLVTFALDHQDALLLKALKDGDGLALEVVLRAAGDEEIVKTQPVTIRTIIDRYGLQAQ